MNIFSIHLLNKPFFPVYMKHSVHSIFEQKLTQNYMLQLKGSSQSWWYVSGAVRDSSAMEAVCAVVLWSTPYFYKDLAVMFPFIWPALFHVFISPQQDRQLKKREDRDTDITL